MYEEQLSVYSQQLFKMTIWTFFSLEGLENKENVCVSVCVCVPRARNNFLFYWINFEILSNCKKSCIFVSISH